MRIGEIYQEYQIMPQLAEHQLKVAGVAKLLCAQLGGEADSENVIAACLLHDMGNIIKFDLGLTSRLLPGRFTQGELAAWGRVKAKFLEKYGPDEHHATLLIADELGTGPRIRELIDCIGFANGQSNSQELDMGKKICAYSDMRVGPKGVISLEQRFLDLRDRYEHKHRLMGGDESVRLGFEQGLMEIEKQIFAKCNFSPGYISEEKVRGEIGYLSKIELVFSAETAAGI